MEIKKRIVLLISFMIGAAFLYFGFSSMLQKQAAQEKAQAMENTIVKKNPVSESSDGLDNLN